MILKQGFSVLWWW